MTLQPDFDIIAKYYDLIYADRDDDLEMWLNLTADVEDEILEIGCGTGRILLPLLQNGHRVTGVDVSNLALKAAQTKIDAGEFDDTATLYQADMRNLDLPQKNFAFAFIPINTFMHCLTIADQQATLNAIYNHLQPGGTLVVDLYHPNPHLLLEADGRLVLENEIVDDLTGRSVQWFVARHLQLDEQIQHITFILDELGKDGSIYRSTFSFPMRYVHRFELELLLNNTGFEVQDIMGDYDRSPFSAESPRIISIAHKMLGHPT
jgi:ubiquinone/menaquinone biosynthesis C-methylase UbiE